MSDLEWGCASHGCGIARPHYHRDTLDGDEVQWINPLDRGPLVETLFPLAPWDRECRQCGCSDEDACVDPSLGPCRWVEWDLCSACEDILIVDDVPWNGETTRARWEWAVLGAAFLAVFLLTLWLLT